jgi:hypothetical protein
MLGCEPQRFCSSIEAPGFGARRYHAPNEARCGSPAAAFLLACGPSPVQPESDDAERDLERCNHDLLRLRCLELHDSSNPGDAGARERETTKQQTCSASAFPCRAGKKEKGDSDVKAAVGGPNLGKSKGGIRGDTSAVANGVWVKQVQQAQAAHHARAEEDASDTQDAH